MDPLLKQQIKCPHCGHHYTAEIDSTGGDEDYYEDCPACCCSIHITVGHSSADGTTTVAVDGDDEQLF
ncbi:CPXCG motif-containing cysteine-rich protein [Corallincola luteus]|uniref:CPXCG motif-containing cysteine-rich protein n=1 Tax=Corallincola luteus TaxID=1775177 RepID=A0ABY2AKD9_9GAMM|nr:CPXCG motif-containing cysteine-rich protein [Corallincola luteus]TCI02502.1 CPXCG motif-containing cysteine-rich protein [Corallincola luteus]